MGSSKRVARFLLFWSTNSVFVRGDFYFCLGTTCLGINYLKPFKERSRFPEEPESPTSHRVHVTLHILILSGTFIVSVLRQSLNMWF